MPKPTQPPTPQRAATATPTGRIWALLAAHEGWEQATEPRWRTQHTGLVDTGR
jgi:hypothetical protein